MKWSEVEWSEVKWSEVKWSEVKWSEMKCSEVKWNKILPLVYMCQVLGIYSLIVGILMITCSEVRVRVNGGFGWVDMMSSLFVHYRNVRPCIISFFQFYLWKKEGKKYCFRSKTVFSRTISPWLDLKLSFDE